MSMLYDTIKNMSRYMKRLYSEEEICRLLRLLQDEPIYPHAPQERVSEMEVRKAVSKLVSDKILKISDFSSDEKKYYLPNVELKKSFSLTLLHRKCNTFSGVESLIFSGFINPYDLVDVANVVKYLYFKDNDTIKSLESLWESKDWDIPIVGEDDIEEIFDSFFNVVIHAFDFEIPSLAIKESKGNNLSTISFDYDPYAERKPFFVLQGFFPVEHIRTGVIKLGLRDLWSLDKIKKELSRFPVSITIIVDKITPDFKHEPEYLFSDRLAERNLFYGISDTVIKFKWYLDTSYLSKGLYVKLGKEGFIEKISKLKKHRDKSLKKINKLKRKAE